MSPPERDESACDLCAQENRCMPLSSALAILRARMPNVADKPLRLRYRNLVQKLQHAGYSYPESGQKCLLAADSARLQLYANEAVLLLRDIDRAEQDIEYDAV